MLGFIRKTFDEVWSSVVRGQWEARWEDAWFHIGRARMLSAASLGEDHGKVYARAAWEECERVAGR